MADVYLREVCGERETERERERGSVVRESGERETERERVSGRVVRESGERETESFS